MTALLTFRISLYLTATRIPLQIPLLQTYLLCNCLPSLADKQREIITSIYPPPSSSARVELFATKRDTEKRVKENLARRVKRGYKGERNDDARRLKGIHPKLRELVRISTFASYLAISGGCLSLTGGGTSPLHSKFATLAASTWPSLQWGRAKITGLFRRAATLETLAHCRLIVPSRIVTSSSAGSTDRYDVRNVI